MTELHPILSNYVWIVEVLTVAVAILIALSSADDLFVDLFYWIMRLTGGARANTRDLPPQPLLDQVPERPIAVMIPAWKEHEVIYSMLSSNSRLLRYELAHYFVGVYQNDPLTQAEVRRAQADFPNITMVIVPRDGPTSKANCLNEIIAGIFMFEAEKRIEFAGIAMHDSENLIHPHEMKLFNVLIDRYDFVQLPVFSFARPLRSVVGGIYMDEFAEMHTKDLEVRERLSGVIPCAGVSACFSREAIVRLTDRNNGEAFRTSSFTEDYDIAFRVSELGFRSAFVCYDADYAIDIDIDTGAPAFVNRRLPIATREFFPSELEAAYRQRARWLLGIVFQGTKEHGWKGSAGTKYFLMRDRKGIVTSPAVMLAYVLMANLIGIELYRRFVLADDSLPFTVLSSRLAIILFLVNLGFLVWRLVNRITFTWMIYDLRQALMSAPRLVVGNFVNFFATWRATRIYLTHLISGAPLIWDKTSHSYPIEMGLLPAAQASGETKAATQPAQRIPAG